MNPLAPQPPAAANQISAPASEPAMSLASAGVRDSASLFPALDLERIFESVKRRIWMVVVCFLGCVTLAILYLLFSTKIYKSSATIYVEPSREQIAPGEGVTSSDTRSLDFLKSLEGTLVPSTSLLVIERENLLDDHDFLKPKKGGGKYGHAELVEVMSRMVKAKLERGTRNITITVTDKSAERAKRIADAYAEEFQNYLASQLHSKNSKATEMLTEQAEAVRKRALDAAATLQRFREKHVSLPLDEGGVVEKRLSDLDKQLSDIKNERVISETELKQLERIPAASPEKILGIGSYSNQDQVSKTLTLVSQKRSDFERVKSQYQPSSPVYKALAQELIGLQKAIQDMGRDAGDRIRKRAAAAISNEEELVKIVETQKREVLKLNDIQNEYRSLKSAVDANWTTYQQVLGRINETTLSQDIRESSISITIPPMLASKPVAPKKSIVLGLAGIMGIMMGSGFVAIGHLCDRTFRSRKQVESTLSLPVLADIPQASVKDTTLQESLHVSHSPTSLVAESFRSLRTSLSALSPRSVLVTSAMPNEGKSFVATNLALMQAQLGYRTLLIDADFRKPSLGAALLKRTSNGQTNEPKNVCLPTRHDNLFLLSCGKFAPNTGELLTGEHFASMLWEAYRSFDCVIIDSSPLGVVSDALSFARFADAVALVVRSGESKISDAQKACHELRRMRAPLAGCILNGVDERSSTFSYYQNYQQEQNHKQKNIAALPSFFGGSQGA